MLCEVDGSCGGLRKLEDEQMQPGGLVKHETKYEQVTSTFDDKKRKLKLNRVKTFS